MKKFVVILGLCLVFAPLFSQSSQKVNRKTAERYLKLAENAVIAGNDVAALSNTNLALAYDDSISDLYYISALLENKNGASLLTVKNTCETAFEKNTWLHDNQKSARILYSDVLCDLGFYEKSLDMLDAKPMVYSADAEVIRVKNYYRMGSDEDIKKARQKIKSARRVYKNDLRFSALFFNFETAAYIRERLAFEKDNPVDDGFESDFEDELFTETPQVSAKYEVSEELVEIAELLDADLRRLNPEDAALSLYPAFFMEGEKRQRKILEYDASGKKDILWAVLALEDGIIDEASAFDYFFEFADERVDVNTLRFFISLLNDEDILSVLEQNLTSYHGSIIFDQDGDLQYELEVTYDRGRPKEILYDENNDGEYNLTASCDFGEVVSLTNRNLGLNVQYGSFPYVDSARIDLAVLSSIYEGFVSKDEVIFFRFVSNDAVYEPLDFLTLDELDYFESPFYIPYPSKSYSYTDSASFVKRAAYVDGDNQERKTGSISYALDMGVIKNAYFYDNGKLYAECLFEDGIPLERAVDYDGDGYFETVEAFEPLYTPEEVLAYDSQEVINRIFTVFDFATHVYLSSVSIDSNRDNVYEFMEEYGAYGAKTTTWDNDNDNLPDVQFIRYEKEEGEPLVEESIFVYGFERDVFAVTEMDGIPVAVRENDDEYEVLAGENLNFFWICKDFDEAKATGVTESLLIRKMEKVEQGLVRVFDTDDVSYFAIKAGDDLFVKQVPVIDFDEEEVLDVIEENDMEAEGMIDEVF